MANVYRMFSRRALSASIVSSATLFCVATCTGQTATANGEPPFKVEVRDLTSKFRAFYAAASSKPTSEPERWALFEKLDGFLAVPPTERGQEEGRKLLDQAWLKYPGAVSRIALGASGLHPSPQNALNNVSALLEASAPIGGHSEEIVLVPFVGTFDHNASAAKSSDGKPMIAVPVEVQGSEVTMTHEFTHVVNEKLGSLWSGGPQTVATLMFTEGLAMRASKRLVPGQPEFAYVSFVPDWYTTCQATHPEVLKGLKPHLLETDEPAITRFTYGNGASGETREAYCGGWFVVGDLLAHGWTFPALARISRAHINSLVEQTVATLSGAAGSGAEGQPAAATLHVGTTTEEVKRSSFRGRLYKPAITSTHRTGVLLIGGTEGHLYTADDVGPKLAALGYTVLGVDYHDAYDGGRKFSNVPVEGFIRAASWLKGRLPLGGSIVALGYSRGTEAALLTASLDAEVPNVAVFSPSSVVWGAMGSTDPSGPSGWSYQGKPLPFLLPSPQGTEDSGFATALLDKTRADAATIPVQKIKGQVFITASDSDAIWPSGQMARQIASELEKDHHEAPVTLLVFSSASHRLLGQGPSAPTETYKSLDATRVIKFGGTALGNEEGRDAAWSALVEFLRQVDAAGKTDD